MAGVTKRLFFVFAVVLIAFSPWLPVGAQVVTESGQVKAEVKAEETKPEAKAPAGQQAGDKEGVAAEIATQAATQPGAQPGTQPATQPATQPRVREGVPGPASTQGATTKPEDINKGLTSPRATMATFLEGMAQLESRDPKVGKAAWNRVLATMDASQVSDPGTLRNKAEELKNVLDRLGEVRPGDLPAEAEVEQTGMGRFRYFPRQPEHAWVWKELKAFQKSPDGNIVLARDETGAWRFSARTMAGIDGLYTSLKDLEPRSGSAHLMGLLGPTFAQTSWLGWVVLLGAIFGGLVLGRLSQMGLMALSKWSATKKQNARATAMSNLAGPVNFAFLTAGLHFGMHFIYTEPDIHEFISRTVQFLVIIAVGWLMYNLVEMIEIAIRQFTEKTENKLDDMVVPLIRKALRVFLVVIFTLFVAQNVFGLNITSWLAGLGIAGLAVSLAAQDSVKNLFGSLTVFFDRPFGVGDWIKFEGFDGTVEEIGFRSSRLRTLSGHLVTVPNMKFIDGNVENMSARPFIRRNLNVTIPFDTPVEKVEEAVKVLKGILSEPPVVEGFDQEKRPAHVAFDDYNPDSLNIKVYYWYVLTEGRDYWTYLEHAQDFNLRVFKSFGAAGIKFSFPKQTPYVGPDGVAAKPVVAGVPAAAVSPVAPALPAVEKGVPVPEKVIVAPENAAVPEKGVEGSEKGAAGPGKAVAGSGKGGDMV